jgi:predicted nucleic acid-binding protein
MRVVVDTNVFISAGLKESSWPGAVIRWLDRFGGLLKTAATEQEVSRSCKGRASLKMSCHCMLSDSAGYSPPPNW